ncbi:unnamed protein product [Tuber melanosporum]|uniref:(Perigord truffle) hypothetical protein n=1 Tax=Tuber melanosporum (strain Mel28) TaxID=656061 RepID=D5GK57_TUBMM|nr:uncharacterized protein GSTUM_00009374001 [Tuber melanosporum]CAZ84900.1 unnamed protein product [Tuber melanosporum]
MQVGLTPKQSGIMSVLTSQSSAIVFGSPSDTRAPVQHFRGGENTRGTAEQDAIILANRKSSHNRQSFEPRNNLDGWPSDGFLGLHPPEQEQLDSYDGVDTADNTANYLFLLANAQRQPQDTIGAFHSDLNAPAALRYPRGPACSSGAMVDTSCPVPSQGLLINSSSDAAMGANRNRNISGHSIPTSIVGINDNSNVIIESSHHERQDTGSRWDRETKNSQEMISGPTSVRRKAENGIQGTVRSRVKKAKGRDGQAISLSGGICDEQDGRDDENGKGTAKMTDEEKRKSFWERNRLAALKCRERKKKWIANLEEKVERFSRENAKLSAQVISFREEIVSIRTLLLAYSDCPVARANTGSMSTPNRNSGTYNEYGHMTTGYYDITTCMGGGNIPHLPMGGGYS